jgi:hypothetical protein
MKGHIKVDGRLLQTNKKWSHLKMSQKEWIDTKLKEAYKSFVGKNNRKPNKEEKEEIINNVYGMIEEKQVWLPLYELKQYFQGRIQRYDNQILKEKAVG